MMRINWIYNVTADIIFQANSTQTNTANQFIPNKPVFAYIGCPVLGLLTIAGNLLTILGIGSREELRTKSNILIMNLACADFLSGIMTMLCAVFTAKKEEFVGFLCVLWFAVSMGTSQASVNALLLVTTDRYIMISYAYKYDIIVTKATMITAITIGWISAALVTILPLFGIGSKEQNGWCRMEEVCSNAYKLTLFFVSHLIPLATMYLLYARVGYIAYKHRKQIQALRIDGEDSVTQRNEVSAMGNSVNVRRNERKNWKAAKTVFILLGYYTVSWLWFFINILLTGFDNTNDSMRKLMNQIGYPLAYLNPILNSVIYVLRVPHLKSAIKSLLFCWRS